MCCAMEAAGWSAFCSDADCHSDDVDRAPADGCNEVEAGNYQNVLPTIKPAPATLVVCDCFLGGSDLDSPPDDGVVCTGTFDRPRDWLVSWQFVRRAAAPAHAPDSLNA